MTRGPAESIRWPGLVWGYDCTNAGVASVREADLAEAPWAAEGFRWLHLNLSDQRSRRWLTSVAALPDSVTEMLLSNDEHSRYLIDGALVCGILTDIRQEFQGDETEIGAIRFALGPAMMITARTHPVRCADICRQRIVSGPHPLDAASALDVLLGSMSEVHRSTVAGMDEAVQEMEYDLLRDRPSPGPL